MGVGVFEQMKEENMYPYHRPKTGLKTFYYNIPIDSYEGAIDMLEGIYTSYKDANEISLAFVQEHLDKTKEFMKDSNLFHVEHEQDHLMGVRGPLGIKIQLTLHDIWSKMERGEV